jgi:predicted RNase H-like nuclease (RuvC/YqgF family)
MDTNQILLSLMVAFLAALPGIAALIAQRKKVSAEAEKYESESDKLRIESGDIVRKATMELASQYKADKDELEARYKLKVSDLESIIDKLRVELKDAYTEVKRLNEALKFANRKPLQ